MTEDSEFSFDTTYKEHENFFGHPYKELQEFFTKHEPKGSILDLGCGQGRDALFLASLGYHVTAIDISQIGITQLLKTAKEKGLAIKTAAADVLAYQPTNTFDIILFDMLLHSFNKSEQQQLLRTYAQSLNSHGIFCIVYPDDMNADHFMNMLKFPPYNWKTLDTITINDVPKMDDEPGDFTFEMLIVQRTE